MAYILENRRDIQCYWIAYSKAELKFAKRAGFPTVLANSRRGRELFRMAGVYVVNQVKEQLGSEMDGIVLLNLWHGVGVKDVERGFRADRQLNLSAVRKRVAKKYIENNSKYRNQQCFLVTSPAMEDHFVEQIGLSPDAVIRAGYPQNCYPKESARRIKSFNHRSTFDQLAEGSEVGLYCPTPRGIDTSNFVAEYLPDLEELTRVLARCNRSLVLKMHPRMGNEREMERLREVLSGNDRICIWDNANDVYEVLSRFEYAIVDYSSMLYDLISAGITKFVRYVPDLRIGENKEDSGREYLSLSCGKIAACFEDLCGALIGVEECDPDDLARLRRHFWAYESPDSCERIVKFALEFEVKDIKLGNLHSFDVFDTLITRQTVAPRGVFFYVKQKMRENADRRFPEELICRYPEIRAQAEAAARLELRRDVDRVASGLLEISFDEIFRRIADLYRLSDSQRDLLREWELEAEYRCSIPLPEGMSKAKAAIDAGEDVVLISDMYLPESFVRRLLAKSDPELAGLPLFLSSEFGVQKTTQELYMAVYERGGYDYARWIHCGDNKLADGTRARGLGISPDIQVFRGLDRYEANLASTIGNYDAFVIAGMLRESRLSGQNSPAAGFAYSRVAAYLVPYVEWVLRDALERETKRLFFISRDGHYLKLIADVLIESFGFDIKTAYIFGSRKAWRLASQIDHIDSDLFANHGNFAHVRSRESLLEAARLDEAGWLELFPDLSGVLRSNEISPEEAREINGRLSVSEAFRDHLLNVAAKERQLVCRYLGENINFSEKFAFVEYWGRGYTQDCLTRLLAETAGSPFDNEFYYARSINDSADHSIRRNYTLGNYSLVFIESIFSNLPYGTVKRYENGDNGEVVPVFDSHVCFEELHEGVELGVVAFARDYARLDLLDRQWAGRELFRFGFDYFRRNRNGVEFVRWLAPLRDGVGVGAAEREYAPALTWRRLVEDYLGNPFAKDTSSIEMSLARSSSVVRTFYGIRRTENWLRVLARKLRLAAHGRK